VCDAQSSCTRVLLFHRQRAGPGTAMITADRLGDNVRYLL
jgi:hypothetical protein